MSSYGLGFKALKKAIEDGDGLAFHQAKMNTALFKGDEESPFKFVEKHFLEYKVLPQLATLEAQFPDLKEVEAPEPLAYYLQHLNNRFRYDTINAANLRSQELLKQGKDVNAAEEHLRDALNKITLQRHAPRIVDMVSEGPSLVLGTYGGQFKAEAPPMCFGWDYMDRQGGNDLGEVAAIVGRPAAGKTWFSLYIALANCWWKQKENTLFVSMEVPAIAMAQRTAALYAGTNYGQLKKASYSTKTLATFIQRMGAMGEEDGKLYIVDANLAATVDEIFALASVLECTRVVIDGTYMLTPPNPKMNDFEGARANTKLIKQRTGELGCSTCTSWQFNREAAKKHKAPKGAGQKAQKAGLEDIAYSDAVGQYCANILSLDQVEGVETMNRRRIELLKGRDGLTGGFDVHWDFDRMNFREVTEEEMEKPDHLLSMV